MDAAPIDLTAFPADPFATTPLRLTCSERGYLLAKVVHCRDINRRQTVLLFSMLCARP